MEKTSCTLFAVVLYAAFMASASEAWKELPLDSCRKVPGLAENMMGVCLEGKTLYAIGGGTLYALDVSEPENPTVLGSLGGMDNNRQVVSQDGFVYVVSRETGLRIVDARDPRNLKLRSRYDSVEFATGIDVVGTTAFLSERINGVVGGDGALSDPICPDGMSFGIPRADGNLVLLTNRSGREASVWDFADTTMPKMLRKYSLAGNPDIGVFFRGKAVIPAGHQGLIMEK